MKTKKKGARKILSRQKPSEDVLFESIRGGSSALETLDRMRKNLPRTKPPFPRDRVTMPDSEKLLSAPLIAFKDGGGVTYFGRVRAIRSGRGTRADLEVRCLPDGLLVDITPKQITHILSFDSQGHLAAHVETNDLITDGLPTRAESRTEATGQLVGQASPSDEKIADAERPLLPPAIYSAYLLMWVNDMGRVDRIHITSEDSLHISRAFGGMTPVTLMEIRAASYHVAREALSHIWSTQLQHYLDPDRKFGGF